VDGFWPAIAYTALGDRARALAWLERALAAHSSNIPTMKRNLELAPLRGDPCFESIARRAGLSNGVATGAPLTDHPASR
jgi:hypothetical protein